MCGICGYIEFDPSRRANPEWLSPMMDALTHRGPDDKGSLAQGHVALGHCRLSIIDLSQAGRQPMPNEDGTVWVVFNGEFYNFRDYTDILTAKGHVFRSHTDTEVLIHLYEEYGIECLSRMNGMFAFALWDRRKNEFFLVRDRMGVKPLHYAQTPHGLAFASEIKSLLCHPDVRREIDFQALHEYLSFEYVPAPRSIFKGIKKMMPGHYLYVKNGECVMRSYWSVSCREPAAAGKSEGDYAEELLDLMRKSVKRRLVSDVPLGVFLSGGIDSSAICCLMQELIPGKVKSFNIRFDIGSFDESAWSQQVANYLGTQHYVKELDSSTALALIPDIMKYLDEPFGDASFIPTFLLSQFTRAHVKVALSGDGGDELFAGYPTYSAHRFAEVYRTWPAFLRRWVEAGVRHLPVSDENISRDFLLRKFLSGVNTASPARRHYQWLGSFLPAEKRDLYQPDVCRLISDFDEYGVAEEYFAACPAPDILQKLLHCDQRFYLQDDMLVKVDRASMGASLEARVPFLDYEVVEFVNRMPSSLKLKGMTTKYILKKMLRKKLPSAILNRKKKGFGIPVAKWFKKELKPLLLDVFSASKIKAEGIFNPVEISRLLEEHWRGRADHRKKLYTLLNFELWFEKYMH